jgi:phosphate transport system substrate-binding protein
MQPTAARSAPSVIAAAAEAAQSMPDDFRVSITNARGKEAHPISSFTWLLIPGKGQDDGLLRVFASHEIDDATKKKAINDFLHWILTDGQQFAEPLAYARLPEQVISKQTQLLPRVR